MTVLLILYALVAAGVFGWLLNDHLHAESSFGRVPTHLLVGLPVLWLPALLGCILALLWALARAAWRRES